MPRMAKNRQNHDKKISVGSFLPTTMAQMNQRGWKQADVILITADAYVDHPSFGVALIGRRLEKQGYKVAILSQPDWKSVDDFRSLGRPRLLWGITSGAVDSRLNDYASMGHKRNEDVYSPGGKTGFRPARPLLVYSARAREAFKDVPIVLGGLEASLRRLVHYDYIEDKLKRSVLIDAKADMLVHGMGELAITQIAQRLDAGQSISELTDIAGTAYPIKSSMELPERFVSLPSLSQMEKNSDLFLDAQIEYQKQCLPEGLPVVQDQDAASIVVMPPARPLSENEIDELYALPFTRSWHPKYDSLGGVPALEPVQFSITTHRGCFGGCSFCSIFFHQGKQISSRSIGSIIDEAQKLARHKDFKGTIHDVGGPSANMYAMKCKREKICNRASCLFPSPCRFLDSNYTAMLKLMNALLDWKKSQLPRKINIFIASGVRYDLANMDRKYIDLLAKEFVGGHLKVAPEHYNRKVLDFMGKPDFAGYQQFEDNFRIASKKAGKEQYLVPYFISSHPGCSNDDALELTEYLLDKGLKLRQVQDFTPVPLTLSTAMFVACKDSTGKKIFVAKGHKAKQLQAALMQYYNPKNRKLITEFLSTHKKRRLLSKIEFAQKMHMKKHRD